MTASVRVAFVVNNAAFFLSHRANLARAVLELGHEVFLFSPESASVPSLTALGMKFVPIEFERSSADPRHEAKTIHSLIRAFRDVAPTLVHCITAKPVVYGGIAAQIARVPAVVHAVSGLGHTFIANSFPARARRVLVRGMYFAALRHRNQRVIFQNVDDRAEIGQLLDQASVAFIRGSGVDLTQFRPVDRPTSGPLTITMASRLLHEKGVVEYLTAARMVGERVPGIRFLLAGDIDPGNPSSCTRDEILSLTRMGGVEWLGHTSNESMPKLFAESDVVCLPSYREGLPRVLIEAAACGRPIVTTDAPGCRDVVTHRVEGLLVAPRSTVALAEALLELISDAESRRAMGQRARVRAETEFSLERVTEETMIVYRDLLRNSE